MSEIVFKICGLATVSVMLILILKKWGGEGATLLKLTSGIVISTVCIGATEPIITFVRDISLMGGSGEVQEATELMLRVLAVAVITNMCSGLCRDCGEPIIGGYVEIGGKVEILTLSLPMIRRVIDLAMGMI